MIVEEIIDLWDQRPFVPFQIVMADGSVHLMENPKWMMVTPDGRTIIYVNQQGPSHRLATHLITRLSERPKKNSRAKGRKRG
jgi:hypothetical protein